jgi:hypothetical protein
MYLFKVVSLSNIVYTFSFLQQNRFGQDGEVRTVVFIDPASVLLFVYEHVRVCVCARMICIRFIL